MIGKSRFWPIAIILRAHTNVLFAVKVKILAFIKESYMSPPPKKKQQQQQQQINKQNILTIEPKMDQ